MSGNKDTFWDAKPCEAEDCRVNIVVREVGDEWNNTKTLEEVCAIRIRQDDQTFYLDRFSGDARWWLSRQHPDPSQRSWWAKLWCRDPKPKVLANVYNEVKTYERYA